MTITLQMTLATVSVPAATGETGLPGEARSASKHDASSLRADALPDVGPGFFDAVLRASSSISPSGLGAADPRLSPSLMFEPADRQAGFTGSDRRANVRSGGEGDSPLEINRYDRTSVDARRTEMDSRGAGTPSGDAGRGSQAAGQSAISHDASFTGDLSSERAPSGDSRQTTARAGSATRPEVPAGRTPVPATGTVTASSAATASPGVGNVSGGAETTRTSAMLVGRLLATGQGADADGLRGGAQSGASAASARSNEPGDTPTSRPKTAQSSAGRGTEAGGSADRVKNPMFDQLVRSIRLSENGRQSSARLQLNPPELGRMDVEVSVVDDRARIMVKTQTDAARWLVQERASELVAALERHGISVERMDVGSEVLTQGFDDPGDQGAAGDPAAQRADQHSGSTHSDRNASEDASSRPVEPDGEPVEPAWRSESAVVAKPRLDIRV